MPLTVTTESPAAAVAATDPNAQSKPRIFLGLTMGLLAAAIGALYSVYATYGLARGLTSADMTLLRAGVAGILTFPVLVYYLRFDAKVLTGMYFKTRRRKLSPGAVCRCSGSISLTEVRTPKTN
jgi:hypothetical protein